MARDSATARVDRLTALLTDNHTAATTSLADLLDAVTDPQARALLTRAADILTRPDEDPDVSPIERAHVAAWLHRGLWSHPRRDPSMADLLALTSPVLPWPS